MGSSFSERLRRFVGSRSFVDFPDTSSPHDTVHDMTRALADEALSSLISCVLRFPGWCLGRLLSGEALNVVDFAQRLGEIDPEHL